MDVQEGHEPRHKTITGPFEDGQEDGQEGRSNGKSDEPAFENVGHEHPRGGLVETVLLLEDEGLIDGEGEGG